LCQKIVSFSGDWNSDAPGKPSGLSRLGSLGLLVSTPQGRLRRLEDIRGFSIFENLISPNFPFNSVGSEQGFMERYHASPMEEAGAGKQRN
jgi:hypothetical protein